MTASTANNTGTFTGSAGEDRNDKPRVYRAEQSAQELISVLLPVRNAAATLDEAMESILSQTWSNLEVLVIDDGSTDASAQIAWQWQTRDPRVQLLANKGVGLVAALQSGAEIARGKFIARMDADDRALPQRLEKQMALLQENERCAVAGTHVRDIGEVGNGRKHYSQWLCSIHNHDDVVRNIFVECPVAHPTLLLRREAFEAVGGYRKVPWAEDYDLVLRLWLQGWRFAIAAEPLLEWRDHPQRLSRSDLRYSPDAFRRCKLHYLLSSPYLRAPRELLLWGAGKEGKWWLKNLPNELRPTAVVEVDPRKIRQRIHGVPVIAPHELGPPQGRFLIVAVGVRGARDDIRPYLKELGWRELDDYVFVC